MKKGIILILAMLVVLSAVVFAGGVNQITFTGRVAAATALTNPLYGTVNFTITTQAPPNGAAGIGNLSNCSFFSSPTSGGAWTLIGSFANASANITSWSKSIDTTLITTGESNTYRINVTCYNQTIPGGSGAGDYEVITGVYIDNQAPALTYRKTPPGDIECTNGKVYLDATGTSDLTAQTVNWTVSGAEAYEKLGTKVQLYGKDIDKCGKQYNINVSLSDYANHSSSRTFNFLTVSTTGGTALVTQTAIQEQQQKNMNKVVIEIVLGILALTAIGFVLWLIFKKS